jgi:hypothetical protein
VRVVDVVGAVLTATVGEPRRGGGHSAEAGRVDVIGPLSAPTPTPAALMLNEDEVIYDAHRLELIPIGHASHGLGDVRTFPFGFLKI